MSKEIKEAIELMEKGIIRNITEISDCYMIKQENFDQALKKLRSIKAPEQPPAGEYPNSEFIKVQKAAAQCAIDAYEEDEEWCPTKMSRLLEACDRLDRVEAINKDLLVACEGLIKDVEMLSKMKIGLLVSV